MSDGRTGGAALAEASAGVPGHATDLLRVAFSQGVRTPNEVLYLSAVADSVFGVPCLTGRGGGCALPFGQREFSQINTRDSEEESG
jgi:hypothetical protein